MNAIPLAKLALRARWRFPSPLIGISRRLPWPRRYDGHHPRLGDQGGVKPTPTGRLIVRRQAFSTLSRRSNGLNRGRANRTAIPARPARRSRIRAGDGGSAASAICRRGQFAEPRHRPGRPSRRTARRAAIVVSAPEPRRLLAVRCCSTNDGARPRPGAVRAWNWDASGSSRRPDRWRAGGSPVVARRPRRPDCRSRWCGRAAGERRTAGADPADPTTRPRRRRRNEKSTLPVHRPDFHDLYGRYCRNLQVADDPSNAFRSGFMALVRFREQNTT